MLPSAGWNKQCEAVQWGWSYRDGGNSFSQGNVYGSGESLRLLLRSVLLLPVLHCRGVQINRGQGRLWERDGQKQADHDCDGGPIGRTQDHNSLTTKSHWCDDLRARPAVCDSRPRRRRMTQLLCWCDDCVQVRVCTHQKHKNTRLKVWMCTETKRRRSDCHWGTTSSSHWSTLTSVRLTGVMWPVRGRIWCRSPALRLGAFTPEQVNHTTMLGCVHSGMYRMCVSACEHVLTLEWAVSRDAAGDGRRRRRSLSLGGGVSWER